MIFLPFVAIFLGFIVCYVPSRGLQADEALARYTALAIIAGLDTILGGLRAWLSDEFDDTVFVTGFFANSLLAVGLVALGEKLGLETGLGDMRISVMMVAAVVVFSGRILNNLAALRRILIHRWRDRRAAANINPATFSAPAPDAQ